MAYLVPTALHQLKLESQRTSNRPINQFKNNLYTLLAPWWMCRDMFGLYCKLYPARKPMLESNFKKVEKIMKHQLVPDCARVCKFIYWHIWCPYNTTFFRDEARPIKKFPNFPYSNWSFTVNWRPIKVGLSSLTPPPLINTSS